MIFKKKNPFDKNQGNSSTVFYDQDTDFRSLSNNELTMLTNKLGCTECKTKEEKIRALEQLEGNFLVREDRFWKN